MLLFFGLIFITMIGIFGIIFAKGESPSYESEADQIAKNIEIIEN